MIIVQTPLRISFFGGGTDFPGYFRNEGGCVLSSAIDKYIFVTIKQRFDDAIRVGYTRTEIASNIDQVQHELIREALRKTGVDKGVEITTMGDIPAGSGLGSSSAVTVGALHAMYSYQNELVTAERLAQEACEVEITTLGKPIGKQDQYICAYGGLRFLEFNPDDTITCEKVELKPSILERFTANLLLFYTGVTRQADEILDEQRNNIPQNGSILRRMKQQARLARELLCDGKLEDFGYLLNETWQLKKSLARLISNGAIEENYSKAIQAGALGGKVTGAGGGGFLLLFCPPERHESVRRALNHLRLLPVHLESNGTCVIFNYPAR